MRVENITGYGKGFVDSLSKPEYKKISFKLENVVPWGRSVDEDD